MSSSDLSSRWSFFTNHAHVLFALARDPDARLREVASAVGITERAVQRIVHELEEAGVVSIERVGRRNHYRIHKKPKLRHEIEAHRSVGELLSFLDEST